jgi:4-alpha-glucanotransferase
VTANAIATGRRAGVLVPLFSFPSSDSWGIGEIADVMPMAAWLSGAGHKVLQLLPLNEMAPGQSSPYSALSAMAIDPIYIRLDAVAEYEQGSMSDDDAIRLREAQHASRIDYQTVRRLKQRALSSAFHRFYSEAWRRDTDRARAFRAFRASQTWWIDEYALFRAIHAQQGERPWTEWPDPLRRREPQALEQARHDLSREILSYQYLQWLADLQWQTARAAAQSHDVALFGDLPFMVDRDSADVWSQQDLFDLDVSIGVPPDAFSATGQDWGMPSYRWDAVAGTGFRWLRERARRSADLYDGYRIDHLVGFYRTFARPLAGGDGFFTPATEPEQQALGERVLSLFREPGAEVVAEDLGTVPDFVRASLARLQVPGFCVLRWERHWHTDGQPFRDPSDYPPTSVATSGTHDTEPLATWWATSSDADRAAVIGLPTVQRLSGGSELAAAPYLPSIRDALLQALFASSSTLSINVIQDLFGWSDRINIPSTVTSDNWTFRLPWPVDRLEAEPEARERQATLLAWSQQFDRF